MLKFGTPTIALPLAIKKCTVQTGCTVAIFTNIYYGSISYNCDSYPDIRIASLSSNIFTLVYFKIMAVDFS